MIVFLDMNNETGDNIINERQNNDTTSAGFHILNIISYAEWN